MQGKQLLNQIENKLAEMGLSYYTEHILKQLLEMDQEKDTKLLERRINSLSIYPSLLPRNKLLVDINLENPSWFESYPLEMEITNREFLLGREPMFKHEDWLIFSQKGNDTLSYLAESPKEELVQVIQINLNLQRKDEQELPHWYVVKGFERLGFSECSFYKAPISTIKKQKLKNIFPAGN